jgi:hypothetical protein
MIACLHKFRGDVTYNGNSAGRQYTLCTRLPNAFFFSFGPSFSHFSFSFVFVFFSFTLVGVGNVCRARNNSNSKKQEGFFFGCLNGPEKKIGFGKVQQRGLTRIDHTTLGNPYFSKGKLNVEKNSFPSSSLGNTRQKKKGKHF